MAAAGPGEPGPASVNRFAVPDAGCVGRDRHQPRDLLRDPEQGLLQGRQRGLAAILF